MKLWKQLLLTLALVLAGFVLWANLFAGAIPFLRDKGLMWVRLGSDGGAGGSPNQPGGQPQRSGFSREALVIVQPASEGVVNDRLSAIGSGQALRTVTIRALASGQISAIPVTSGMPVKAGDVILELDSVEEKLALERAELALGNARDRADRVENLLDRKAASEVEMQTARNELANAELALREATIRLERRSVRAPISGTLGILSVNAGDYVTSQDDIATIDDYSDLQVEFFAPERFTAQLAPGVPVKATAISQPGETFSGEITTVDNRIDQASRTLRVRARIDNADDRLRAGMSFAVTMAFDGDRYPTVDPLAVQWSGDGSFVWRVAAEKSERVPVKIVQRNPDKVLVDATRADGDPVVTEGLQRLRDGGAVSMAGQQRGDAETPKVSADETSESDATTRTAKAEGSR